MDLKKAVLFFGLPGMSIFLMFTWVYELLLKLGFTIYWATFICLWGPLLVMLGIVFIRYHVSRADFKEYFLVNKLSRKQILVVLGAFIIVQVLESLLVFTRPILASLSGFHVPSYFPDLFRAEMEFKIPLESFLGMQLSGNIFPVYFWLLWLITNIGCEEILWRGYALPRMEKYFGKRAWLVNGLLWNICIHFFMRWSFIALLPVTLIVPYLSQKYKSMWPGVIIHGLGNMLIFAVMIPSIVV
ncbi:MAG: CPBP family intramembrane glutamic endopeptidase [Dehalobacterium sp.]